ncbi:SAM-dependent methyltransferase [Streptomyces angustmyceticus]|uniref:SAM-dependent methyltransferase n=1 Tax=Streptomyces angustmyceticus TaxID=285578 RepID=UPI003823A111
MPTDTPSLPTGVSLTAVLVTGARAAENARPDALYRDPLADQFLAPAGSPSAWWPFPGRRSDPLWQWLSYYIPLRTKFFDDYVTGAQAAGCQQIVLLGAGLDSRAFRLPWAGRTVPSIFEVDVPQLCVYKEEVLARYGVVSRCSRTVVPADVREDWPGALLRAGFDPGIPTAWLSEALSAYLTYDQNDCLLRDATALSAPGSRFATEHWQLTVRDTWSAAMQRGPAADYLKSLVQPGCSRAPEAWFALHGWRTCVFDLQEHAESCGRPTPPVQCVRDAARAMRNCLVTADRP